MSRWGCLVLCALLAVPAQAVTPREQVLRAGHLLRHLGFGPNRRELHAVLRVGVAAYVEQQLAPDAIDDRIGERRFQPEPTATDDGQVWQYRWLTRMVHSRRQLLEKMTLLWHQHFATSNNKVGAIPLMRDQEQLLRGLALGNFRDLLAGITRDNAMLIYLDNGYNDGRATDDEGNPLPPNASFRSSLNILSMRSVIMKPPTTLIVAAVTATTPSAVETGP